LLTPTPGIALGRLWWRLVLLLVLMFGTVPVFAQPAPPQSPAPSEATHEAESGKLQARIDAAQVARSIRLLQTVTEHVADEFVWPMPFTLEMQSCDGPNARWDLATHKLTLCYELAAEFADKPITNAG
jgi:hypothetical protein